MGFPSSSSSPNSTQRHAKQVHGAVDGRGWVSNTQGKALVVVVAAVGSSWWPWLLFRSVALLFLLLPI